MKIFLFATTLLIVIRAIEGCSSNGNKPLQRASSGRSTPRNLSEMYAMQAAMAGSDYGREIVSLENSKTWNEPGWFKMAIHHPLPGGGGIEIHYNRNKITCEVDDFKFKD